MLRTIASGAIALLLGTAALAAEETEEFRPEDLPLPPVELRPDHREEAEEAVERAAETVTDGNAREPRTPSDSARDLPEGEVPILGDMPCGSLWQLSRARQGQQEDVSAKQSAAPAKPGYALTPGVMGEIGIVEELARARRAYERALDALHRHYEEAGTAYKRRWVETERRHLRAVPRFRYLRVPEMYRPNLKPDETIAEADRLYAEALRLKERRGTFLRKREDLKVALDKLLTLIHRYPKSDKVDDAAFHLGEIYAGPHYEAWEDAVRAYERCFQWNPKTGHAARFRAAEIYETKLARRNKAVHLYREVLVHSDDPGRVIEAADRIEDLTGRRPPGFGG